MAEIITSEIEIQSGVISSGLTVDTGGIVTVLSGGTVTESEAANYGYFWVEEGGHISNIHLTHSGDAMVDGGSAENLTMESAGQVDIFAGTLRNGTIRDKGFGVIYTGGSAFDVSVSAGGRYLVNGGYAENTVVSSGGSFTVQITGGLADKTTIEAGGHARITSDGQMWETILNGGRLDVISGRILATTLNAGELHVSSGGPESGSGSAETTVVNAGAFIVSGATATDTTLNGGEFIVSGGAAQKTTVNGGDFIASDATVQSTTVSGGEFIASDAEVQSTTVSGGAVQFIGGTADKTDIFSGTVLVSGGTVQNTTLGSSTGGSIVIPIIGPTFTPIDPNNPIILNPINWDDIILVADGGTATITYGTGGSILLDGGATVYTPEQRETIGYAGYPGQTVNGDEASAGAEEPVCRLDILNGGLAVSTTVNSGLMQVFEGGVANETTVKGGTVHISGGGIANNIAMSGGGGGSFIIVSDTNTYGAGIISFNPVSSGSGTPFVTVFEGGVANNITVSGGLLTLSGGTANDVTLAGGTFHVSSGGIANNITMSGGGGGMMSVRNGALANDATLTNGRIQVESGTIRGATVTGGTVRFMEGGTLSGAFTVTANADVYMESGSVIAFDITGMTPGAEAKSSGLYYILGAPSFTLTVSDIQAAGIYALSKEAAGFRDAITVQNQFGEILGTLTVGNTAFLNNQYYTLRVTDNVLNLTVLNEAPARMWDPVMVFVNDAWASLPEGSTVEPVAGLTATIGVDAFSTGRDATNAVAGNGTVIVAGGEASFQYGITRDTAAWYGASVTGSTVLRNGALTLYSGSTGNDLTVTRGGSLAVSGVARNIKVQKGGTLTVKSGGVCSDVDISASGTLIVEAGAYLTGTGKFASGSSITVYGTINFDLTGISAFNSALFSCNNVNINGAPNFTITVSDSQENGIYTLAERLSGVDGLFTLLNVRGEVLGTLSAGKGVFINDRVYMLDTPLVIDSYMDSFTSQYTFRTNGSIIRLTIADKGDIHALYVNNTDWAELEDGTVVNTPSGLGVIGIDAFGDLKTAEEHLTEDVFIVITGGTYASETISVGITMEGGTIGDSVITETGSLTLNKSSSAMNLTVDGALVMNSSAKASDLTVSGRLVMNDSSEAESITVTGNLVLNGYSKTKNLTANEGAVVRGADNAGLDGAITIGSGATLTGSLKFGEVSDLVIDGVWNFDISGATIGKDALFRSENNALVSFTGTTAQLVITVSATQDFGVYKLASGITGFEDAVFTIVSAAGTELGTISAGESIVIGKNKYTLNLSGPAELSLTVRGKDSEKSPYVYVNSDWADLAFGTIVYIPDGGNAIIGFNAFSDLKGISDYVSESGTVTVVSGSFEDGGSITRNVQVLDATIAGFTVSGYGTLILNEGAKAKDITVSAGSLLTVNEGATLTISSPEFLNPDAFITIQGNLCLDLTGTGADGPAFVDASILPYSPMLRVEIGGGLSNGIYSLVSNMTEFNGVEIYRHGVKTATITALDQMSNGYGLTLSEDSTLQLIRRNSVSFAYVNPAWAGLEDGTVLADGYTIGYNAFSTVEDAEFATADDLIGMVDLMGGTFSVPGGLHEFVRLRYGMLENTTVKKGATFNAFEGTVLKDIVVEGYMKVLGKLESAQNIVVKGYFDGYNCSLDGLEITVVSGGTFSGGGTVTENSDITVDGVLEFRLGKTFDGFSYIKGTPEYKLNIARYRDITDRDAKKPPYVLAKGVDEFDGTITVRMDGSMGYLTVGNSVLLSDLLFTLTLEADEESGKNNLVVDFKYTKPIYLSSSWEGLEEGTTVTIWNGGPTETATIGVDAFWKEEDALAASQGLKEIRIYGGTYSFADGLSMIANQFRPEYPVYVHHTVIMENGSLSLVSDSEARNITVSAKGSFSVYACKIDSLTAEKGSYVSISYGSTISGFWTVEDGVDFKLTFRNNTNPGSVMVFDVYRAEIGGRALFQFGSTLFPEGLTAGGLAYIANVSGTQEYGEYLLVTGLPDFKDSIAISVDGVQVGSVSTGGKLIANGKTYTLKHQDNALTLTVAEYVQPSVVYLNSAWKKMPEDTVVEIPGGTAVIGYDAFAEIGKALVAAGSDATVAITGGTFVFADGIDADVLVMTGAVHDSAVRKSLTVGAGASAWNLQVAEGGTLTVEAGGKLTGWAVFAEGVNITVDGTLDFDISKLTAGSAALYEGLSYVQGDTAYTLTVRAAQTPGFYYLAYGADGFKSAITLTATDGTALGTLRAGMSTRIGDALYTLNLGGDGILSLSIAPASSAANTRSDVDGNGVSDVLFQYTGGDNQTGYWMNGKDTWRSSNAPHPAEWTLLGAYDMDGDGIADSVFVGNGVEVDGVKGAYIGYYKGGVDTDDNWVNIHFLENEEGNVWLNKIGNLTGNPDKNSIVWHCAGLGALGVWTDGTSEWTSLGAGFDSNWTMVGCGDFNGDGRDSVVMSYLGGVKYYAIGLDGSAVDMGNLNWSGWEVRAIGDFAGDGKDDMILFHKDYGAVVMIADGNLDNYTAIGQLDAKDWFIVGAGDYNGDGKDDLLVRQYSTGMLGYYSACDTSKWGEMGRGVDMDWTVIA